MKLGYVILYVRDVQRTVDFYASAFGLTSRFVVPTGDYGELALDGSTTLAFAAEQFVEANIGTIFRRNRPDDSHAAGAEISFVVDRKEDVAPALEKAVRAGAVVVQAPKEKPWGQVVAYVKDLNGFLVELCSPVSGDE